MWTLQCLLAPADTVAAVMTATRMLHACSWEVNNNNNNYKQGLTQQGKQWHYKVNTSSMS
jgi:hypothetical protein